MAEDWQQRVVDKIAARTEPKGNRGGAVYGSVFPGGLIRTHVYLTERTTGWLLIAARAAGVNRSTFVRRAVAVQIAHILGLPMAAVLRETPGEGEFGKIQRWRGGYDSGVGIDRFCPHPGCNGRHLRP